jgi:glycine/D-amino acid oxidase-like deaminating enzyme
MESVELPPRAEVAILGAGIMGSATAYWLARAGQRPVVLERNPGPAQGATGRNGGLHVTGPARDYAEAVQAQGRAAAQEIVRATFLNQELLEEVLAREDIDAHYQRTGFMSLAASVDERALMQASARLLQADGFPAEWLDRPAAIEKLGTPLAPEFVGALFKSNDAVLHSARYTLGVAQAALRRGARFAFSTSVVRVEPGPGGRGWAVHTSRGLLMAEQLVVTLNAWADEVFPELERVLTPVRGHIVLTAPVEFRLTPWSANQGYEYGRQLENGQLLIGGMRHVRADMDRGHRPVPGGNVPEVQPEVVRVLSDYPSRLFPKTAGVPMVHHWTGMMDFSPDHNPLAGRWPGREGLWLLVGLSGHGMPYSLVLPRAIAAQVAGVESPIIPTAFDPARFLTVVHSLHDHIFGAPRDHHFPPHP